MRRLPWVGLPTDSTVLGHHRFAVAGEKYVRALAEAAEVTRWCCPACSHRCRPATGCWGSMACC